jgi:hypothetical protein
MEMKRVRLVTPFIIQQLALFPIDNVIFKENALMRLDPASAQLLQSAEREHIVPDRHLLAEMNVISGELGVIDNIVLNQNVR